MKEIDAAIEALDEAMAYTSSPFWSPSMTKECAKALAGLRSLKEQEPVAWMHPDSYSIVTAHQKETNEFQYGDEFLAGHTQPLYAHPAHESKQTKQVIENFDELKHEQVARVAEVHMSRYTIEWTNGPLPEGTKLYIHPETKQESEIVLSRESFAMMGQRISELEAQNAQLLEALKKIATVNAMDYEYQEWASAAIAQVEGKV